MQVCAKFQVPSSSRSSWKVCGGGVVGWGGVGWWWSRPVLGFSFSQAEQKHIKYLQSYLPLQDSYWNLVVDSIHLTCDFLSLLKNRSSNVQSWLLKVIDKSSGYWTMHVSFSISLSMSFTFLGVHCNDLLCCFSCYVLLLYGLCCCLLFVSKTLDCDIFAWPLPLCFSGVFCDVWTQLP